MSSRDKINIINQILYLLWSNNPAPNGANCYLRFTFHNYIIYNHPNDCSNNNRQSLYNYPWTISYCRPYLEKDLPTIFPTDKTNGYRLIFLILEESEYHLGGGVYCC